MIKDKATLRLILHLAWPTMLEELLTTAVSYVDTAMVGSLGSNASAAVGCTMTVNWMLNGIVSALGVGFISYIARAIGAGKPYEAKRAAAQSVLLAIIGGAVITLFSLPLAKYIPVWMQADEGIREDASMYFFILYIPMLFRAAIMMFGTILRASGDTRTPMRVNIASNLINVVLNFIFIYETRSRTVFGLTFTTFGFGFGVTGAAIASAIAFIFGGIVMTRRLYASPIASPKGMPLKPDPSILKPCFKVAMPACAQRLATSFGYVAFSAMINKLGSVSTAAHTIANTAESAFYIPGWGMQTAASTLIGNAYGERNRKKFDSLSRMLLILEFGIMVISGTVLFCGAKLLMSLFTPDADVIKLGSKVLRMVAVSEPIYGVAIIIEGIFNGIGDTFHQFIFNVIGMWGVRILGTFIFVQRLGYQLPAAWACMIAHNVSLGIMLSVKYMLKRWLPKELMKPDERQNIVTD